MKIETAKLRDGRTIDFVPQMIGEGGMKQVFFTPDKSSVVCFFKDAADAGRVSRLEAVLGKFNPTTDVTTGRYFSQLYCWPTGVVVSPRLGVVCPTYPKNFFFQAGPWVGKEKEGKWFTGRTGGGKALRELLPPEERGTWINYFGLCIQMARAVKRLHVAGLAHSDLSPKNILVDPSSGQCIVIDIDSLVVPGLFPPDVLGTTGYIAPEVLATVSLPLTDPKRKHPCVATDQHALPVLLYEYLLFRHPLKGPKVNSTASAEEDDLLSMGAKALFIEHPADSSNRPKDLRIPFDVLGPHLKDLFLRAFVNGLHSPNMRPIALEWEKALLKTWEIMYHCTNASCSHQWFVVHDKSVTRCPFCGTRPGSEIVRLQLRKEAKPGMWVKDGEITIWNGKMIHSWHVFDNVYMNENLKDSDKEPLADCQLVQGQWLLINRKLTSLTSPGGNRVPPNSAVALKHGAQIRLSQEPHGRIAEVAVHPT
jgi:serine/threonine protein kinase